MRKTITVFAFLTVAAAVGYAKPDIEPQVTYAPTWKAAVQEGVLLNVPIVLHKHGFN